MQPTAIQRFRLSRRARQLASGERVGRYARGIVWEQLKAFFRRMWKVLLFPLLMPLGLGLLFTPFVKGANRWILVGATGISGPWLVAVITILYGGVATTYMGLEGENFTADVLRRLQRSGWRLANGIKIRRNADIDHVMVGPGGILVIESKWSHHRWPTGGQNRSSMSSQLSNVVSQALRNKRDFEWRFKDDIKGVSVRAVCVLWSSVDSSDDAPWFQLEDVLVVRGSALELWFKSLPQVTLDDQEIARIWMKIEKQVISRDEADLSYDGPPIRSFDKFLVQSVLTPALKWIGGFYISSYGLMALSHYRRTWLDSGILISLAIGLGALRNLKLRRVAQGWLMALGLIILLTFVQFIRRQIG